MDENTWRFAQLMMWLMGLQTTVIMAAFGAMWKSTNKKFEGIDKKFEGIDKKFEGIDKKFDGVDKKFEGVNVRFDKLELRLTRLENDMIEVKTILRLKESCMIKDDSQVKKVE